MSLKQKIQDLGNNGAMLAIATVGLVVVAGHFSGGSANKHYARPPARRGSPKRRRSGSRRRGSRSAYTNFVGPRMRQLIGQGYSNKQAMKKAASEWSARKGR
jgi:hypothetical protein